MTSNITTKDINFQMKEKIIESLIHEKKEIELLIDDMEQKIYILKNEIKDSEKLLDDKKKQIKDVLFESESEEEHEKTIEYSDYDSDFDRDISEPEFY